MSGEIFVHPSALVETTEIGEGTRVWAFAHVMEGAVVGTDCKIGDHSFIESGAILGDRVVVKNNSLIWHGVSIGDDVFVGPNTVFTNVVAPRARHQTYPDDWEETEVADRATIGANSTIVSGIRLGYNCMIGAGSVVTKDVPDHALVYGNPAEQAGWVCDCGHRLDDRYSCPDCSRHYETWDQGLRDLTRE
jgi:UDP-2-acetamido-3-amino-2,3-dideoxy-glucuronate N-acetyltransferase